MTVEEIKNQLEELIRDRESFMVGDYDKDIYDRDKEALVFAVKALEKQIPEKLTTNGFVFFCPECRGSVWQIKPESRYCFRCGQALDWSGENE